MGNDTSNDANLLNAASHLYNSFSGEPDTNGVGLNDLLHQKYQGERGAMLQDAYSDKTIDKTSKKDIAKLEKSGGRNDQLKSLIEAARSGKGIYAVRKIDQAQRNIVADMPGRRQLSPTYGS